MIFLFTHSFIGLTVVNKKEVPSVTVDATSEQERIEAAYEQSARSYEEQRRRQHVLDWLDYHRRQRRSLEVTLGGFIDHHEREEDRYHRMLNGMPTNQEGEKHG